jgi:hypothetical protein
MLALALHTSLKMKAYCGEGMLKEVVMSELKRRCTLIAKHCSYFEDFSDSHAFIDILISNNILSYIAVNYVFF